jgi:TetR/AcrR family transcriptional regulator, transcriptional repressor for nem operon
MRKSKLEAAETRRRIVSAAAQEFCRNGIHATGLSDLMAAAGLTHGGFYKHFRSKDQVVAEACVNGLETVIEVAEGEGKSGLEAIVETYLSMDHRNRLSGGCPLAALGSELAQADDEIRAAASQGFIRLVDVIAKQFPQSDPEAARAQAVFVVSAMVGALTMSRMVTDPDLSALILDQSRKQLDRLQGQGA